MLRNGSANARLGLAVGQIVGGIALAVGGATGELLGGAVSVTGIGALVGVPAMAVSATLVTGGVGNVMAGIQGLTQSMMSGGSGTSAGKEGTKIPNSEIKAPPTKRGNAPTGEDGHPVELHHRDQTPDSPLDELTRTEHRGAGNFSEKHSNTGQQPSKIDRSTWKKQQKSYWKKEWDSGRFEDK